MTKKGQVIQEKNYTLNKHPIKLSMKIKVKNDKKVFLQIQMENDFPIIKQSRTCNQSKTLNPIKDF
jgi:hypothetical protein